MWLHAQLGSSGGRTEKEKKAWDYWLEQNSFLKEVIFWVSSATTSTVFPGGRGIRVTMEEKYASSYLFLFCVLVLESYSWISFCLNLNVHLQISCCLYTFRPRRKWYHIDSTSNSILIWPLLLIFSELSYSCSMQSVPLLCLHLIWGTKRSRVGFSISPNRICNFLRICRNKEKNKVYVYIHFYHFQCSSIYVDINLC